MSNALNIKKNSKGFLSDLTLAFLIISLVAVAIIFYEGDLAKDFHKILIRNKEYLSILKGLGITILIAVSGLCIGIIIGLLISLINFMKSNSFFGLLLKKMVNIYVLIFRGTPITVQLLIVYFIVLSNLGINPVMIAVITFGLNSGAYVSEILRGGIMSIPKGQHEAGLSLGLSYYQTMYKIIFPQGIKNALPSIGNEFISLIKETSVVGFIAVTDLTQTIIDTANATFTITLPYLLLGAIYLVLVLGITIILKRVERGLTLGDRN